MTMMTRMMTTRWTTLTSTSSNRPDGEGGSKESSFQSILTEEMRGAFEDMMSQQKRLLDSYSSLPPLTRKQKVKRFMHRLWSYRPVIMTHRKLEEERHYYY